jgi:FAD/FMN-containing dehydrogenase
MALMAYAGEVEAGERALAPFRSLAEPIADMVKPMRYPEMYGPDEPGPDEEVARSMFIDAVDVDVAGAIVEHLHASTAMMAVAQLRVLGGAMARVPDEATAFAHRKRRIMVALGAIYENREEETVHREWVEDFAAALYQGESGVYVGFLGDEGEERVRAAYPGTTWERLAAVKARYDPENFFSLNQNISPKTGRS